jgi:hypothetical protein
MLAMCFRLVWISLCAMTLAGCARVEVAIGNSPDARFTHVWITLREVWFNTNATAAPEDTGWTKQVLATPVTIDLASLSNGSVQSVASAVKIPAGLYSQLRLILAASDAALTDSARTAGLLHNNEVDFTDADGTPQQIALDILSPALGIGAAGTFQSTNNALGALVAMFDTQRDIVAVNYGSYAGYLLRPNVIFADSGASGAIAGHVDSSVLETTVTGGAHDIVISAQTLSPDGTYHKVVASTTLANDGSFLLAPLPVAANSNVSRFDVVISGRNLKTVVIKDVNVSAASSATSIVTDATQLQSAAIPIETGTEFAVNVDPAFPLTPRGVTPVFYQTLPGSTEVPYVIRSPKADPLTGLFPENIALSAEPILLGTYRNGSGIDFVRVQPTEGENSFLVYVEQPHYLRLPATRLLSPADAIAGVSYFAIPILPPQSPAFANALGGQLVRQGNTRTNAGVLIIAQDGEVVNVISLNAALAPSASSQTFSANNLPGGSGAATFPAGVYQLDTRTWLTTDTAATVHATSISTSVSLRAGSVGNVQLPVD